MVGLSKKVMNDDRTCFPVGELFSSSFLMPRGVKLVVFQVKGDKNNQKKALVNWLHLAMIMSNRAIAFVDPILDGPFFILLPRNLLLAFLRDLFGKTVT